MSPAGCSLGEQHVWRGVEKLLVPPGQGQASPGPSTGRFSSALLTFADHQYVTWVGGSYPMPLPTPPAGFAEVQSSRAVARMRDDPHLHSFRSPLRGSTGVTGGRS